MIKNHKTLSEQLIEIAINHVRLVANQIAHKLIRVIS